MERTYSGKHFNYWAAEYAADGSLFVGADEKDTGYPYMDCSVNLGFYGIYPKPGQIIAPVYDMYGNSYQKMLEDLGTEVEVFGFGPFGAKAALVQLKDEVIKAFGGEQ